jgi:ABC-type phosphate transport system substrate-binding protein
VTLTVQTLAKIFSGKITNWRDSEILDLNPTLSSSFPNKEIKVIYREDSSGTSNIFTEALSFYSRSWNRTQGTFTIWPKDLTKKKNFKPATGNFGIFAEVESSPYTISYISFPFLVESGSLSYANMKVKGESPVLTLPCLHYSNSLQFLGDIISRPDDTSRVRQAVSRVNFDKTRQGSLVEAASEVEGAWPISGFSYLVLDTKNDFSRTDCEVRRGLFKWLKWTLTDKNALARAERKGYISLTPEVASFVLTSLEQVDCRDQQLLGGLCSIYYLKSLLLLPGLSLTFFLLHFNPP